MTLIRTSLYNELIDGRIRRLEKAESIKAELKAAEAELATMTTFVANYDATQASLQKQIATLETSTEAAAQQVDKLKGDGEALYAKQQEAEKSYFEALKTQEGEESKLAEVKKEGTEEEIKAQQKKVDEAQAATASKKAIFEQAEKNLTLLDETIKGLKDQIELNQKTIEESDKQMADNAERKSD